MTTKTSATATNEPGSAPGEDSPPPVVVAPDALSNEALHGLIEAFVLREGTDYGAVEYSMAEKVAAVRGQLDRGEAVIVFNPATRSADIVESERVPNPSPAV